MLKRAADWLEKMSVVAIGVGLFEEKSLGIAFGLACIYACLYLTSKLEGREVIAWLFAAIACMGIFLGALYFNHRQAKEAEKQKTAQPKPAAEEVISKRPAAHIVGNKVYVPAEVGAWEERDAGQLDTWQKIFAASVKEKVSFRENFLIPTTLSKDLGWVVKQDEGLGPVIAKTSSIYVVGREKPRKKTAKGPTKQRLERFTART